MDYHQPQQGAYVRLTDHESESPAHASGTRGFFFPNRQYTIRPSDVTMGDSDDDDPALHSSGGPGRRRTSRATGHSANGASESTSWWKRLVQPRKPAPEEPQSDYLTLIPLSDSRLKPQRTRLIVGSLLVLAFMAVSAVYVLVPRGVTVGTIQVHSSQISFNTSKSTYQILLTATIPVYNPNYLSVTLSGTINVSFYDQQAGYTPLHPVQVAALAQPQVITLSMDASSVPQKYLFTIYTQCFTFPEKLIFFLTGSLQAVHLFQVIRLPLIDNYFIIACNQSPDAKDNTSAPALQASGLQQRQLQQLEVSLPSKGHPP